MEQKINRKFLEDLDKHGFLYFYLVTLISSDELLSVEDCENSLKELDFCLDILPENDLKDKEKVKDFLIKGKEIVNRDLNKFKQTKN